MHLTCRCPSSYLPVQSGRTTESHRLHLTVDPAPCIGRGAARPTSASTTPSHSRWASRIQMSTSGKGPRLQNASFPNSRWASRIQMSTLGKGPRLQNANFPNSRWTSRIQISTSGKGPRLQNAGFSNPRWTSRIQITTSGKEPRLQNASLHATGGAARGGFWQPLNMVMWCVGFQVITLSLVLTPLFFVDIHLLFQRRPNFLGYKHKGRRQHLDDHCA